ncbi:hypothetical protein ALC53_06547 [Atta colombica]|uniref:HAT C-terminal dimerisation domain-containing protein n=1 Tax=Atta colombica TaxID=520822 RepID=A0A195BFN6_9HYME|nr:hypothetical protein ALC53_06547 [Atta colombica]
MCQIKDEVKKIIKYFKYTYFPMAKYKQADGTFLNLSIDVRWNSLSDCFELYLKNCHIVKIYSENRIAIDKKICPELKILTLKAITTLDKVQNETRSIGEAIEIWIDLLKFIRYRGENLSQNQVKEYYNMQLISSLSNGVVLLHTVTVSSASIDRLFSIFGLFHSKICNRLRVLEKASKLVSIIRTSNLNSSILENN